ncbi:MAG: LysR family transcriptional regulator [Lachnospiraceae bacterium]
MNLNQLHYFTTLAHMEHYTKAAELLEITQPSLSHAISALEKELGTYLFEKKGRNVVLTKYGKFFLQYAEKSLDILSAGVRKTKSLTCADSGVIDIGYIYSLGTKFIPCLLHEFLEANPEKDIQFNITAGNTTDILRGLKEEKFDVAFCSKKEDEKKITFTAVAEEELVVIVPMDHDLAGRKEIDLIETVSYPQIIFTKDSGLRPVIDQLFQSINVYPKVSYEIEENSSIAGMVAEGFGIAVLPNIPVLNQLNVDIIKIKEPEFKRYIYMANEKHKFLSPITELFIRFTKETRSDSGRQIISE